MNKIRQIQELNKKELEHGISPNASWHTDYRDTAFIYFGGLPFEMSEGDVITIFSQYGEPVFLKLARDKETGKSKGFGWLKYEDQRSTDLAVDNLGGASIGGRLISVDHARYKARDDEDDEEFKVGWEDMQRKMGVAGGGGSGSDVDMGDVTASEDDDEDRHASSSKKLRAPATREQLPEERELQRLMDEHDDEDPMKDFLIEEKKKEVDEARRLRDAGDRHRHHHHHHHSHHRSSRSHRSPRTHRSHHDDKKEDRHKSSHRDDKKEDRHERDKDRSSRRERSSRDRSERDSHRDRDHHRDHDKSSSSRRHRDRDRETDNRDRKHKE